MERGYFDDEEVSAKIIEKIKKEYPVIAEKLQKINEKTLELSKICEEISKYILVGEQIQIICEKAKNTLRRLKHEHVAEFIKTFKVPIYVSTFSCKLNVYNSTKILINVMHCMLNFSPVFLEQL